MEVTVPTARPIAMPIAAWLSTSAVLGTLDIVFATSYWHLLYGLPASRVLQGIAAGMLGPGAFLGGMRTSALGLLLHYGIMLAMVGAYYAISRSVVALRRRPWIFGPLYGLLLYGLMNDLVLPLSAAPRTPFVASWVVSSVVVHVLVVGLPIALTARAAFANRE